VRDALFLNRHVGTADDKPLALGLFGSPPLLVLEKRWDEARRVRIVPGNNRIAPSYRQAEVGLARRIAAEPWSRDPHPQDTALGQLALQQRQLVLIEERDEVLGLTNVQSVAVFEDEWRIDWCIALRECRRRNKGG